MERQIPTDVSGPRPSQFKRQKYVSSISRPSSGPPPYIEDLLAFLGERGVQRARGESLEAYAGRLARGGGRLRAAESLLLRYAALRYGGIGSPEALRADVRAWLG